jgi:hypothetical protein
MGVAVPDLGENVLTGGRRPARKAPENAIFDEVVAELREIDRRTGIERILAIGELILNQFFGGSAADCRDRRRNKNNSIRRLAEREDCPLCKSALNEAVGVYVAVIGLPSVRTSGHICASHVASVLSLPMPERQQMLERAEQERWSVRELRQKVILHRRAEGERRGRPPISLQERCLSALRQRVKQLDDAIGEIRKAGNLSADVRSGLRGLAVQLAQHRFRVLRLANARPDVRSNGRGAVSRARSGTA